MTEEVIASRVGEVIATMERLLFHGGYSPILRESFDGSATLLDAEGRVVAGSGLPIHLFPYWRVVRAVLDAYPPEAMRPGDSFALNDPFLGGTFHVPDMAVVTPVFQGKRPIAFCASIAHKPDLGGIVPGSSGAGSREAWHEGTVLPVVRYWTADGPCRDAEAILRRNSRTPDEVAGDMRAQVGCTRVGAERVLALAAEYGSDDLLECFRRTMDRAEGRLRRALAAWPDGEGEAGAWLDGDGVGERPVRIHVRAVKSGDGIRFDFAGSDPQAAGPVNVRPQSAETASFLALLGVVDPTIPLNDGPRRAIAFHNPEGLVTHARYPAPINNYYPTMHLIYSCAQAALARFDPEAAVAPAGLGIGGNSLGYPGAGVQYELLVSSLGGSRGRGGGRDGAFVCMAMSQITPSTPVEILETEYPVRVTACAPVRDSAGPGEFRGGAGMVREYRLLGPAKFTLRMGHFRHGTWGVEGGGAPSLASCVLDPGTEREEALPVLATRDLPAGTVIRFTLPGGGGCGDPLRREAERVLADVRDGLVSVEAARAVYGVVLAGDPPELDRPATRALRRAAPRRGADGGGAPPDPGPS